ncbi:Tesmin/TSO1-like CXC domain-containing protein isoform 1 [Melia azedarach]|uniref:Tesmin/TSO1-like CXC domain-containing protein isoform 1 n=1 Tax=Melia azedarach TaxID=155640 RepID=A0ACC1Y5C0_MELAZ|nr:Tesmin/TSO1-like CXC domain-containing protein isoform 1 [Melia azedarach]
MHKGSLRPNFPTSPAVFRTPRLDPQREASLLKSKEIDATGTDVYGDSGNRLSTILIPCSRKELQSSSPSGCIDEYLIDPGEVEDRKNSDGLCSAAS